MPFGKQQPQVMLAAEDLPPGSPSEALTWVLSSRRLSCSSPLPGTAKLVTELLLADEWHLQNPKWFWDMKKDFFMPSDQEIGNYLILASENLGSFHPNPNWFKDKPLWKSNAWMRGKNDDKHMSESFNSRQQRKSDAGHLWTGKTWKGKQEEDYSTCTVVLYSSSSKHHHTGQHAGQTSSTARFWGLSALNIALEQCQ